MLLSEYVLYVLEMLQQQNTESQYEAMLSGIVGEHIISIVPQFTCVETWTPGHLSTFSCNTLNCICICRALTLGGRK